MDSRVERIKIGVLGPLPPPYSGTTVSYKLLVDELSRSDLFSLVYIGNTQANHDGSLLLKSVKSVSVIIAAVINMRSCKYLIINGSNLRAIFLVTLLFPFSLLFRVSLVARIFGGSFHKYLENRVLLSAVVRFLLRRTLFLLETKEMMRSIKLRYPTSFLDYFPNSRPKPILTKNVINQRSNKSDMIRIVMMAEVREEKGIYTLIEAAKMLQKELSSQAFSIDVYGQLIGEFVHLNMNDLIDTQSCVRYCGLIKSDDVPTVLSSYDIFCMPTHYKGEGYSGAIIEALHAGLAIITTKWNSMEEMIDESCGILVSPKNPLALKTALKELILNDELRKKLSQGSIERSVLFDSGFIHSSYLSSILNKWRN